ncbi:MAG: E2 ligase fold family C protein [Acidobacteria bacterium]|nr:E2 ligase fold family C protein [Acidobacteriota bacterium]
MGLANFFDKSALAASRVLQGVSHASLAAALDTHVVGLAFDDAAAFSPEGRLTLEMSANLLARLYPRIALTPHGHSAEVLSPELASLMLNINPELDISAEGETVTVVLAAGDTSIESSAPVIYAGSDGWIARVSSQRPVGSGSAANPFGAGAAACFAVANIFRLIFGAHLLNGKADDDIALSLLDYDPHAATPLNPAPTPVDIGESHIVGLGAIGNAAVWALARAPELSGVLTLIDHETVELTNLQRYVLTTQKDVHGSKVALAARQFTGASLAVRTHQGRWGDYLRTVGDWRLGRVSVGVDSDEDRRAIQASLPEWIVNAWTQEGDLGVSRHSFTGDGACLMCLYYPDGTGKNLDQIIAEAIRLPDALMEIRTLLYNGAPVGKSLLERAAAAMGVSSDVLLGFEGQSLHSFYTKAICGGMILRLGGKVGDAPHGAAEVPLAFQSALAGVMLATEIVAHAGDLRPVQLPVTTKIDLLRPLSSYLSVPAAKDPSIPCICRDEDFIRVYQQKYAPQ